MTLSNVAHYLDCIFSEHLCSFVTHILRAIGRKFLVLPSFGAHIGRFVSRYDGFYRASTRTLAPVAVLFVLL